MNYNGRNKIWVKHRQKITKKILPYGIMIIIKICIKIILNSIFFKLKKINTNY